MWWRQMKSHVIVPMFKCLVVICLVISLLVFIEIVYMNIVVIYVKLFKRKPEKMYKWEAMQEDMELGGQNYPMVLVQIPMYNEREVFQLSIGSACRLIWPLDRLIVQVLDDSTDPIIMEMVSMECGKWEEKGINIKCERRDNRNGYKAGALKQGMRHCYVKQCNYIAIFDADFQPEPDYLQRVVPFLIHNPELALVQARWIFGILQFVSISQTADNRKQSPSAKDEAQSLAQGPTTKDVKTKAANTDKRPAEIETVMPASSRKVTNVLSNRFQPLCDETAVDYPLCSLGFSTKSLDPSTSSINS